MKFLSRISISRIKFLICEYIQIIRKQVKNKNVKKLMSSMKIFFC